MQLLVKVTLIWSDDIDVSDFSFSFYLLLAFEHLLVLSCQSTTQSQQFHLCLKDGVPKLCF